jgi:hypothetical protein
MIHITARIISAASISPAMILRQGLGSVSNSSVSISSFELFVAMLLNK